MYLLTKDNIIILSHLATSKELREGIKIDTQDVLIDFEGYLCFKRDNTLEMKFKGKELLKDPNHRIAPKDLNRG